MNESKYLAELYGGEVFKLIKRRIKLFGLCYFINGYRFFRTAVLKSNFNNNFFWFLDMISFELFIKLSTFLYNKVRI